MASTDDKTSDCSPADAVQRAGFVGIIGRPNVGKSTLLNQILGEKLAIASPRPQTTRTRLLGVKNLPGVQLALVDTPGLHRADGQGRSVLNKFMVEEALGALSQVDVVLLVTDLRTLPSRSQDAEDEGHREAPLGDLLETGDRFVAERLREIKKPVLLAVNKIDLLSDKRLLLPLIEQWGKLYGFRSIVPVSARQGLGVDRLVSELSAALPEGPALFPRDMLTDQTERFLAAELIREQVFLATHQEVPYAVAVTVDSWQERTAEEGRRKGQRIGAYIDATVHVEKEAQKKIVVGERGRMVREIGTAAREEIGQLLGCRVHLQLFVRVDPDWSKSAKGLREMGYDSRA